MKKEELVKQLYDTHFMGKTECENIADLILARETAMLEELKQAKEESFGRGMEIAALKEAKEMWDKRLDWQMKKCMELDLIIKEIENSLRLFKDTYSEHGWEVMVSKAPRMAIDEALAIIQRRKGGK